MPEHLKLPETGFMRLKEVLKVWPISQSSWYAGVAKGIYPKPIQLSARCSAYRVEDIRELIERTGGLSNG